MRGLLFLRRLNFVRQLGSATRPRLLQLNRVPVVRHLRRHFVRYTRHPTLGITNATLDCQRLRARDHTVRRHLRPLLSRRRNPLIVNVYLPGYDTLCTKVLTVLNDNTICLPLRPDRPLRHRRCVLRGTNTILLLRSNRRPLTSRVPSLSVHYVSTSSTSLNRPLVHRHPPVGTPYVTLCASNAAKRPGNILLDRTGLTRFAT